MTDATPPEVHLRLPKKWFARRNNMDRVAPISGYSMPKTDLRWIGPGTRRALAIHKAIGWLDVESRDRYLPASGKTYCNIYAYDLAYMLGAYIPRIWWKEDAVHKILKKEKVDIIYGETVSELNANALAVWFNRYGHFFSWKRYTDLTAMQAHVNSGSLGIIVAHSKETGTRGHIAAVIPETRTLIAQRLENIVITPLQSQAGARNAKYFNDSKWWVDTAKFKSYDCWVWDI